MSQTWECTFNLVSGTNETRYIKWHETCKCKFRLDANVSNNKQRWNEGKWRYEFKELIDKEIFNKGLIRILAIANANVINHAMLENISIIITVSVEKG